MSLRTRRRRHRIRTRASSIDLDRLRDLFSAVERVTDRMRADLERAQRDPAFAWTYLMRFAAARLRSEAD